MQISLSSPAKINLYLQVENKLADGYHLLKTVYQSISLCDKLKFTLEKNSTNETKNLINITLTETSKYKNLDLDSKNLIYKSAKLFFQKNKLTGFRLFVELEKNIPKDIKLIGFDNTTGAYYCKPKLSSVKQNTSKIAQRTVDSLLDIINGRREQVNKYQLEPVQLILRESTN